jgi:hypothetical protein
MGSRARRSPATRRFSRPRRAAARRGSEPRKLQLWGVSGRQRVALSSDPDYGASSQPLGRMRHRKSLNRSRYPHCSAEIVPAPALGSTAIGVAPWVKPWFATLRTEIKHSRSRLSVSQGGDLLAGFRTPQAAQQFGPPRPFRTALFELSHAAICRFRYSSWTSCGVR